MTGQWKALHDYKYVVEEAEVVGTSAGGLRHPFWWQTSQLAICCCIRHKLLPHNGHALAAIRVLNDNNLLYWWWWWLLWPVVLLTHACSRQLRVVCTVLQLCCAGMVLPHGHRGEDDYHEHAQAEKHSHKDDCEHCGGSGASSGSVALREAQWSVVLLPWAWSRRQRNLGHAGT